MVYESSLFSFVWCLVAIAAAVWTAVQPRLLLFFHIDNLRKKELYSNLNENEGEERKNNKQTEKSE